MKANHKSTEANRKSIEELCSMANPEDKKILGIRKSTWTEPLMSYSISLLVTVLILSYSLGQHKRKETSLDQELLATKKELAKIKEQTSTEKKGNT